MSLKEKIETIESIITIFAILIGGIWTYKLFIQERKNYPHAAVSNKISHVALSDTTNLLRVELVAKNIGKSHLIIQRGVIRIQQILPILPCIDESRCTFTEIDIALKEVDRKEDRFTWPLFSERIILSRKPIKIEPNESDSLDFEFVLPSEIKVVRIYSYLKNEKQDDDQDEFGWSTSAYYKLATIGAVK